MFLDDDVFLLSWKYYPLWPIEFLEDWPFTAIIFVAGILLLLDCMKVPRLLWHRTFIWWFTFFVLWQISIYAVISCFGVVKPIGATSAYLGLSISYTLVLLFGPPLRVLDNAMD